jgi:hypothetical protein
MIVDLDRKSLVAWVLEEITLTETDYLTKELENGTNAANPGISIIQEGVKSVLKEEYLSLAYLTQGVPTLSFTLQSLQEDTQIGVADLLEISVPVPSERNDYWDVMKEFWEAMKTEMVMVEGNWRNIFQSTKEDRMLPSIKMPEHNKVTIDYLLNTMKIYTDPISWKQMVSNVRSYWSYLLDDRSDALFQDDPKSVKKLRNFRFMPVGMGGLELTTLGK